MYKKTYECLSPAMKELYRMADRAALSDAAVLITGESGTGKEVLANRIHRNSYRNNKAFVAVNTAGLQERLIESELFGHVKGAFTGAAQNREGRFEKANEGTLFLDEIAELPLLLQSKLLRVLQSGVYEPLGSSESKTSHARILSATNKDISSLVKDGLFRADLFYRLNVIHLHIPPLRERPEDIPLLTRIFIEEKKEAGSKELSPTAEQRLLQYSWPGNVRELKNVIDRALVFCNNDVIGSQDLNIHTTLNGVRKKYEGKSLKGAVRLFKREFIEHNLYINQGNVTKTAAQLEIQRTYLSRLIKELGINLKE